MSKSVMKVSLANEGAELHQLLKRYRAQRHTDVSTNLGQVFYSHPVKKWILVRRKGDEAILEFTDDCPCKDMGRKY